MKSKINYLLLLIGLIAFNTASADWIDNTTGLQWKPALGQATLPDTSYRNATFDEINNLVSTVVDSTSGIKLLSQLNIKGTYYSSGVDFNKTSGFSYSTNLLDANGNAWNILPTPGCRTCVSKYVVFRPHTTGRFSRTYYGYTLQVKKSSASLTDRDGDGISDNMDNCLTISNPNQSDSDQDLFGDVCDADFDNNGIVNNNDLAIFFPLLQQGQAGLEGDFDQNGVTNFGDLVVMLGMKGKPPGLSGLIDTDGDGIYDYLDNCITIANPNQADDDQDFFGDACDADFDNNGIVNIIDINIFLPSLLQGQAGLASDFDQNGVTNFGDLVVMLGMKGKPPGPSGLIVTQ